MPCLFIMLRIMHEITSSFEFLQCAVSQVHFIRHWCDQLWARDVWHELLHWFPSPLVVEVVAFRSVCMADRWLHGLVTVVAEELSDPHNVERLRKVCAAFGARLWLVCSSAAASEGPPRLFESTARCLEALEAQELVATALEGSELYATRFEGPVALLFGQEKRGLSPEALEKAPRSVRIPMRGMAQSLNVAASAAVVLTEAGEHVRAAGRR